MGFLIKNWIVVNLLLLFFYQAFYLADTITTANSSIKLDNSWHIDGSTELGRWIFQDTITIRPIIVNNSTEVVFGFGFYSTRFTRGIGVEYYLVVFLRTESFPVAVWFANRDTPVGWNASLGFNEGNIELKNSDGTLVWSTNTIGQNPISLDISSGGNLMLVTDNGTIIWQSFDYPTEVWLLNQNMSVGKSLTSRNSLSETNTGLYSLVVTRDGFDAYIDSDPPQIYASVSDIYNSFFDDSTIMELRLNNTVSWFNFTETVFELMWLAPSGKLNVHQVLPNSTALLRSKDIFGTLNECDYPNVCGPYGICSGIGLCSCPSVNSSYFTQSQDSQPSLGCKPITSLSCNNSHLHELVEIKNVSYFNLQSLDSVMSVENCKMACMNNCNCKAAIFIDGECSLKSDVYSFKYDPSYTSSAFIKVQGIPSRSIVQDNKNSALVPLLSSILPVVSLLVILLVAFYYYKSRTNSINDEEAGDDELNGRLKRFSFLELKLATSGFQVRLGRGGFGSVFEGDLVDGTKVAVKCLDSVGQGRKEFLAEVNTIGCTNHFNLVRLIGYCVERSNRFLVYEHMCKGSLDKWIFDKKQAKILTWEIRKKIIFGLAKGLEYLHVECNPNIIHFDIKPQNILLDGDFNVKISDFGLAKLIDRDKSQVITALKGTPGYVAPELFSGINISVKADVFSFGIVLLEILFGRKNLDLDNSSLLVNLVKEKVKDDQVSLLVEEYVEGTESEKEEVVRMIKIGILCLQTHNKRPSMSTILKVLQGLVELESTVEFEN